MWFIAREREREREGKVITIPRDRGDKSPAKMEISVAFVDFWFIEEDTLT